MSEDVKEILEWVVLDSGAFREIREKALGALLNGVPTAWTATASVDEFRMVDFRGHKIPLEALREAEATVGKIHRIKKMREALTGMDIKTCLAAVEFFYETTYPDGGDGIPYTGSGPLIESRLK